MAVDNPYWFTDHIVAIMSLASCPVSGSTGGLCPASGSSRVGQARGCAFAGAIQPGDIRAAFDVSETVENV